MFIKQSMVALANTYVRQIFESARDLVVQDEFDPAYALLSEHVTAPDTGVRLGAIMGLGLAYAGTRREDVSCSTLPLPEQRWSRSLLPALHTMSALRRLHVEVAPSAKT